jgi:hypothetical protein
MALATVSRWLKRIGLGKRSRPSPAAPANRHRRGRPGELVAVDVKQLGRFRSPGHRALGLRRRRHPARLWRGAARRARAHRRRLSQPSRCRARRAGDQSRARDDRQRLLLGLARTHPGLPQARPTPPAQTPLRAPQQRERRALHPNPPGRLGLRTHLRQLNRTSRTPGRLAQPPQLPTTTRLPRPPTTRSPTKPAAQNNLTRNNS